MDRERVQKCLDVLAAYWPSGQKSKLWAQANGVPELVRPFTTLAGAA